MKLWTQQCKEILFQTLWLNNLEPFTATIGTKNNKEDTYFINNFKTITTANKQLQNYCIKQRTKSKIIPVPWNFSSCVTKTNRVLRHLSFCAFFIVVKLDWMPPTTWQYWKTLINVSLERLFNYVQWPHLKCKHVGRCTNNNFNCKTKWKPRRQHACNTLQAELDTWGYFCCQYAPTHKSPLLSLTIFTYSRGTLCKWVVSDEGLLQAIIILLYHYF